MHLLLTNEVSAINQRIPDIKFGSTNELLILWLEAQLETSKGHSFYTIFSN